jgi:hypothetical protein
MIFIVWAGQAESKLQVKEWSVGDYGSSVAVEWTSSRGCRGDAIPA